MVNGEVWAPSDNKGKKRSGGRPPEPVQPPDGNGGGGVEHVDHFEGQYRQRKKRKLAQMCTDIRENENTQFSDNNTRAKIRVRVDPESSESGSRSV